jgi:hypothetical protein
VAAHAVLEELHLVRAACGDLHDDRVDGGGALHFDRVLPSGDHQVELAVADRDGHAVDGAHGCGADAVGDDRDDALAGPGLEA